MQILYALEPLPATVTKTIFLAGPTPRAYLAGSGAKSWRPLAIRILEKLGFDGVVIVPETRDGAWAHNYDNQVTWECDMRAAADLIFFWIPRDLLLMPAFTTNVEFGMDFDQARTFYGRPREAEKCGYLDQVWRETTGTDPFDDLEAMLTRGIETITTPLPRAGGERFVPAHIWKTESFQQWYRSIVEAGNRLENFSTIAAVAAGRQNAEADLFAWIAKPRIRVAAEARTLDDEFVIGRSDVSAVIPVFGTCRADAEIVLTEEFRAAACNKDGIVLGPPGGSSHDHECPQLTALEELREELGLDGIDYQRLMPIGDRQVAPTMLAHQAHAFALALEEREFRALKTMALNRVQLGAEPERITLRIVKASDLKEQPLDWSSLGMIEAALTRLFG